jgi:unspecific monooxygenase
MCRWTRAAIRGTSVGMRKFSLSPRDADFAQDPFPAYEALRAMIDPDGPRAVMWDDLGMPVFVNHADVSAGLRDRRLGREVLHVATREDLG